VWGRATAEWLRRLLPAGSQEYAALRRKGPWNIQLIVIGFNLTGSNSTTATNPTRATRPDSPQDTDTFVIPEVFQNIKQWTPTETDCPTLQGWFDAADNAHGNQSDVGAMRWLTDLMRDIDQRMSHVGCYG
jgi:hypothetical protein